MFLLLSCIPDTLIPQDDLILPRPARDPAPLDTGMPGIDADEPPDSDPHDTAPPDTAPPRPTPPAVVFNEVAADNTSLYGAADGGRPDYVELYNPTDQPVPLSRLMIRDGSGAMWIGAEGEIAAGGWLLLDADGRDAAGHLPFQIDADGEELTLLVDGQEVDRLRTGELAEDLIWGRFPDGGGWAVSIQPSPGATNGADPGAERDPSTRLFQMDRLVQVEITLDPAALDSLRRDRLTYVTGRATIDGLAYREVGVRLKAYVGSSRTIDQKCGWKIDLNRYRDQSYVGVETLTLNNMVQDPSYIHERLAYLIYGAMGVPAPRNAYARVSVNGTDYGLYLVMETMDENMLSRWFADSSGALYEGAYGVDLTPGAESSFDYDEGPDPSDRSDLTAVIALLQQTATDENIAALERLVNLDNILANRAVESNILHWDGYTTANNYRLYHDPTSDQFYMMPWGTDQTFVDYWYGPWSGRGQLWLHCLQNGSCAERYDQKLIEVADMIDRLDLVAEAERLRAWLYPEILTDPRREFGLTTFEQRYAATLSTLQTYPASIRAQVAAR